MRRSAGSACRGVGGVEHKVAVVRGQRGCDEENARKGHHSDRSMHYPRDTHGTPRQQHAQGQHAIKKMGFLAC